MAQAKSMEIIVKKDDRPKYTYTLEEAVEEASEYMCRKCEKIDPYIDND